MGLKTRKQWLQDKEENQRTIDDSNKLMSETKKGTDAWRRAYTNKFAAVTQNVWIDDQITKLEQSAKAISMVYAQEGISFDGETLDDTSELYRQGRTLVNTGKAAKLVAEYYGGKIIGGLVGKSIGFIGSGARKALPPGVCFIEGTTVLTPNGPVPIEALKVGQRVLTNCVAGNRTKVVPTNWRLIKLAMPNPEFPSDVLSIETLRSHAWIKQNLWVEGNEIVFSLPEMGLHGLAKVEAIRPCPRLPEGEGKVILTTVNHYNGYIYSVEFANGETIEPTARHRLFSLTQNNWVKTENLQIGEQLATKNGFQTISQIGRKKGVYKVYNIEVETDHCYYVGNSNILSHNVNPCSDAIKASRLFTASTKNAQKHLRKHAQDIRTVAREMGEEVPRGADEYAEFIARGVKAGDPRWVPYQGGNGWMTKIGSDGYALRKPNGEFWSFFRQSSQQGFRPEQVWNSGKPASQLAREFVGGL